MNKLFAAAGLVISALALGCSSGSNFSQPPSLLTVVPTAAPERAAGEMRQLTFRITMTGPQMLRMIDLEVDGIMTYQPLLLESILSTPPG
jgi:hypothetical protein